MPLPEAAGPMSERARGRRRERRYDDGSVKTLPAWARGNASMQDLHRSIFVLLKRELKPKQNDAEIVGLAVEAVRRVRPPDDGFTWETAARSSISHVRRQAALHRPMRVYGHIARIQNTQLVRLPDEDEELETTSLEIHSSDDHSIVSLDVVGTQLVQKLQSLRCLGLPVEFLGVPVALDVAGRGRSTFYFYIVDARRSESSLDAIGATDSDRRMIEGRPKTAREEFIGDAVEEMISRLGISGVDEFPLLHDLVEFTVLQALSCGRVSEASARLHLLLVGPPGRGKKLIGLAAKILNPVSAELSASKVSVAGLVGASRYDPEKGWVSTPGLLPRAAGGVALLQDAHGWNGHVVRSVGPILQEVIEDGVVRSATAGGVTREAPVSLVIDANRTTQLDADHGRRVAEAPILRLRPLLSRIDLLCEIPPDAARAWLVARNMYDRLRVTSDRPEQQESWVRLLRLRVADLRDRHPAIDLDGVRGSMKEVHDELQEKNEPLFRTMPEAGDIPARLAISFARFVAASARGCQRSYATEDDVARAVRFLNIKLGFLKMVEAGAVQLSGRPDVQMSPEAWLQKYAGKVVRSDDLAAKYEAETGNTVAERTMRRRIQELGAKKASKGTWRLPGPN